MKVIYEKIENCKNCPWFRMESEKEWYMDSVETWYECDIHNKQLFKPFEIPDTCPLEDYDLFHMAMDAVKDEN